MNRTSKTPAGASAGAARNQLGGCSRIGSNLDAYRAQMLIAAHGVRPEWAAMLAALAFGRCVP